MWVTSICFICDHFCRNNDDGLMMGCRAFPNGIPDDIGNEHDHDNVIKGQIGDYVFTPAKREFDTMGHRIKDYWDK